MTLVHQPDGVASKWHKFIPESAEYRERRGIVRIASENSGQRFYLQSNGPLDAAARASVQIIPANLTFDFEVTTT